MIERIKDICYEKYNLYFDIKDFEIIDIDIDYDIAYLSCKIRESVSSDIYIVARYNTRTGDLTVE